MARSIVGLLKSLSARPAAKPAARLGAEPLESRDMMSVSQLWMSGSVWVVRANDIRTDVQVTQTNTDYLVNDTITGPSRGGTGVPIGNYVVKDLITGQTWTKPISAVSRIEFQGGADSDTFRNLTASLPVTAFGGGGGDSLAGASGADQLIGGPGDDVLLGFGGDDKLWGEGNNDRLNGGAGADQLMGGNGDDVLIAVDGWTSDTVFGEGGRDIVWADQEGAVKDAVVGTEANESPRFVPVFTNGADRTLNGDNIADPTATEGYKRFGGKPLFASGGPSANDIEQGDVGDCWLMAGLGAIANDSAFALRQNVVDFDDGTYGVWLGNKAYRVDADLPARGAAPTYAQLGAQNSMWVAVTEKAYAHYRTGANDYASLDGGWPVEVNRAFGTTAAGDVSIGSYSSAAAMANAMYSRWMNSEAVTVGIVDDRHGDTIPGMPLVNEHAYTVIAVARNSAGVVTSIILRNPWAEDGAGSDGSDGSDDGLVTVTPDQLFLVRGRINWGKV